MRERFPPSRNRWQPKKRSGKKLEYSFSEGLKALIGDTKVLQATVNGILVDRNGGEFIPAGPLVPQQVAETCGAGQWIEDHGDCPMNTWLVYFTRLHTPDEIREWRSAKKEELLRLIGDW